MDGANQRFMHGKARWLADHLIIYNVKTEGTTGLAIRDNVANHGTIGAELPVYSFDLRKLGNIMNGAAKAKQYELTGIDQFINLKKAKKDGKNQDYRTITKNTHQLHAYFLPWGTNATYSGKLGINADFFFTPTLNGCSFAYQGNGPSPAVAHSNFVIGQTVDQAAIDNSLTATFGGAMPANVIKRSDYKQPLVATSSIYDYRMMIVGIRNGNSWHSINKDTP